MPDVVVADDYLHFPTEFGNINVNPRDEYRLDSRNNLEWVRRQRREKDGTVTVYELTANAANTGEM
jgi:hypothetical protein